MIRAVSGTAVDDDGTAPHDTAGELALERAYAQHLPRLVGLGRMLTGDAAAGEDLAQEVFVRLLRATRRDAAYVREPVWPLLRTTLVRLALQRRRTLVREARRLVRVYERPREAWAEPTLDYARALATLPARMRACVVLFYGDDLSTSDVAGALGCSPKTVENQLHSARERLAPRLRELAMVETAR
jgi:RNA polymerase sigma factor (sigma-70 family)